MGRFPSGSRARGRFALLLCALSVTLYGVTPAAALGDIDWICAQGAARLNLFNARNQPETGAINPATLEGLMLAQDSFLCYASTYLRYYCEFQIDRRLTAEQIYWHEIVYHNCTALNN